LKNSIYLICTNMGSQTIEIRSEGYIYVDKTKHLVDLIDKGKIYFLFRPRRFGKSLTVSTFEALFSGEKNLFKGFYDEEFLNRPNFKPSPVSICFMSMFNFFCSIKKKHYFCSIKNNQYVYRCYKKNYQSAMSSFLNYFFFGFLKRKGLLCEKIASSQTGNL